MQVEVKKEDKVKAVKPRPKKLYRIETCEFQRVNSDSEWERGLLLNEGDLGVLDKYGRITTDIWTWRRSSVLVISVGWWLHE